VSEKKTADGGQPTEKIRGNTHLKKAKNRKNAHVHKPGTAGWSAHRHEKTVKKRGFCAVTTKQTDNLCHCGIARFVHA